MIFLRNVMPSMRGISMSRMITSGQAVRILSSAKTGSDAEPMTSIPESPDNACETTWRTTAESSMIMTLIRSAMFCLVLNVVDIGAFAGGESHPDVAGP